MNHFECEQTSVNWLNAAHSNERSRSTSDLEISKTITKINTAALLSFDEIGALLWNASVRHHNLFNEQHFKYLLISIFSIVHIFFVDKVDTILHAQSTNPYGIPLSIDRHPLCEVEFFFFKKNGKTKCWIFSRTWLCISIDLGHKMELLPMNWCVKCCHRGRLHVN